MLTLCGQILVLNTLIGSLFVYSATAMVDLQEHQIKEIESVMRDFIWLGKYPKISLHMLQRKKMQGGLKLFDIRAKQQALKISWIEKIESDIM